MKLYLQVVSVLCALLWTVCFSSLVDLNRKFDSENDEVVRIVPNVHSPTNFSALPSSSVTITAPTSPHEPTNAQNSLAKGMSTSESSTSVSRSSSTKDVVISTATPTTTSSSSDTSSSSSTKDPTTTTPHVPPGRPTATVSPPGSYTPPPTHTTSPSRSQPSTHSSPSIVQPTGCKPPITVTVNNGAYCTNIPSPPPACSSDCTSKIGLSLGISIPGTAILTFLVTSLSCLCCQRVKKKHSYIQLAPTVYFDEEEHD